MQSNPILSLNLSFATSPLSRTQGVATLAFWVLVIAGAVALVASLWPSDRVKAPDGGLYRSREILRERYARGEITREEYEQVRRDLEEN